jgi:ATP-binding protein involved in chromosome partitioning
MKNKNSKKSLSNESSTCEHPENKSDKDSIELRKLQFQLSRIKHKIIVLSGKGGVGKSTVAINLATSLMLSGKRVGLLDVDIHGPSIPTMLGLENTIINSSDEFLYPVELEGMKVMSLGFLLRNRDDAVIWRGPLKMGVIKQFLMDVDWGDLDYLVIDSPPGTGDEPLSVCQLIDKLDGAVIVTTPQKVAAVDVRKSITFCRQLHVPIIGIIENMSGFTCPKCGEVYQILSSGGGKQIADDMDVHFLGSIPIDPKIADSCDSGKAFIQYYKSSTMTALMNEIVQTITLPDEMNPSKEQPETIKMNGEQTMKIAIPIANGMLTNHFGHCESFAFIDVDLKAMKIIKRADIQPPPHEPGLLPPWLAERGVSMIIAGGMGQRAQGLFSEQNIEVLIGAPMETPEKLVSNYLAGTLKTGENVCDH